VLPIRIQGSDGRSALAERISYTCLEGRALPEIDRMTEDDGPGCQGSLGRGIVRAIVNDNNVWKPAFCVSDHLANDRLLVVCSDHHKDRARLDNPRQGELRSNCVL
jgi:hypothetical protein